MALGVFTTSKFTSASFLIQLYAASVGIQIPVAIVKGSITLTMRQPLLEQVWICIGTTDDLLLVMAFHYNFRSDGIFHIYCSLNEFSLLQCCICTTVFYCVFTDHSGINRINDCGDQRGICDHAVVVRITDVDAYSTRILVLLVAFDDIGLLALYIVTLYNCRTSAAALPKLITDIRSVKFAQL
jgi:hypothetical protein